MWFTEYDTRKVGRAPACGLGLKASFANGTLTTSFDLGIDTPATWSLAVPGAISRSTAIPAVAPPYPVTFNWSTSPNR